LRMSVHHGNHNFANCSAGIRLPVCETRERFANLCSSRQCNHNVTNCSADIRLPVCETREQFANLCSSRQSCRQ